MTFPDIPQRCFALQRRLARYRMGFWVALVVGLLVSLTGRWLFPSAGPWLSLVTSLSLLIWLQAGFLLLFVFLYREHRSARSVGEEQFFYWVMEWGGGPVCLGVVGLLALAELRLLVSALF